MNSQIDWAALFFSAAGRVSRGPFLLAAGVLIAIGAVYEALVETRPMLHWLTGWFVYLALIFAGACALSKRLHDRGRSGWWAALILFALSGVWPRPESFFDFVFAAVVAWAVIELGVMAGEPGTNRYGPNPLRPQPAPV